MNANETLKRLQDGNERFVAGQRKSLVADDKLRRKLTEGQAPFACVIACSDSRVPPEIIFDCTAGELFVIRIPGSIQTPEVIGSVEYAVSILKVKLVVVMAHSNCGAVHAAVSGKPAPERVAAITDRLAPIVSAQQALGYKGDQLALQVNKQNLREFTATLSRSQGIAEELDNGLEIRGVYYELNTGQVLWDFE